MLLEDKNLEIVFMSWVYAKRSMVCASFIAEDKRLLADRYANWDSIDCGPGFLAAPQDRASMI